MNFKVIKSTKFTIGEGAEAKEGVAYTVAHKGRAINVSTLDFEAEEIKEVAGVLTVKGDLELVASPYLDELGATRQGLKIKPKMDLQLSAI